MRNEKKKLGKKLYEKNNIEIKASEKKKKSSNKFFDLIKKKTIYHLFIYIYFSKFPHSSKRNTVSFLIYFFFFFCPCTFAIIIYFYFSRKTSSSSWGIINLLYSFIQYILLLVIFLINIRILLRMHVYFVIKYFNIYIDNFEIHIYAQRNFNSFINIFKYSFLSVFLYSIL